MGWDIKEIATNVGVSYFVSWIFFFLMLPLFVTIFGKVNGTVIAYGISWVFMLGVVWIIEKYNFVEKIKTL